MIVTEIFIYARDRIEDRFVLHKKRLFDIHEACMQFSFSVKNSDELIFASQHRIFAYNYMEEESSIRVLHELQEPLVSRRITFVVFDRLQQRCIIVSPIDCVFISLPDINSGKEPLEVDIDDQEDIKLIRNVICDDEHAYVLANKHRGQIGFYLLKIELANPRKHSTYIINWRNKLDIACCDLYIMKTKNHC